jgi:hypothetical protein
MSHELTFSRRGVETRTGKRLRAPRHVALLIAVAAAAVLPASLIMTATSASAAGNASIVGTWVVSGGYLGFTVTAENPKTGGCVGKTASPAYHLVGCHVTASKYSFTITEGPSYKSHNTGTIKGSTLIGRFSDSNGTFVSYTAHRAE